jgi:hypothetical protein
MEANVESTQPKTNFFDIPLNVGFQGGDLPARYFTAAVVLALVVVAAPTAHLSYSALKISTLLASMSGTILLMAGLVFSQKTHYAGIVLITTSLLILGLTSFELKWPAAIIGLAFFGWVVQNLVIKRCGINNLLGINSCAREPQAGNV